MTTQPERAEGLRHAIQLEALHGDMQRGDADETHPYMVALRYAIAALRGAAAQPVALPNDESNDYRREHDRYAER